MSDWLALIGAVTGFVMVIGSLILLYLGKIDLQSRNVEENSQMLLGLMFFLALSGTTAVRAIEPPSNEPTSNYVIHWGIKIPTRDGTELHATAYIPDQEGRWHVVKRADSSSRDALCLGLVL